MLATILVLLLAPPATTPATTPASPTEAPVVGPTEAPIAAPIAAPVADPFAPDAPIPGVPPGVDLADESTWSELSVEDKDRMRAIRAELEYQRKTGAAPAPLPRVQAVDVSEHDRAPAREIDYRYRGASGARRTTTDAWEDRDAKLATATAVTGVVWGAAVITMIVLQFAVVGAAEDCKETVSNGSFDAGNDCSDEIRTVRRAGAGVIVAGVIAGGAGVGVLVSGITLGVHRNSRPVELSVLPLRVRF